MVTKRFTLHDQLAFANLSQDHNPIHIDPIIARRRIYGQPVVYGVNALLWSLATLAKQLTRPTLIDCLNCAFIKPIVLEADTAALVDLTGPHKAKLEIFQFGNAIARFTIEFRDDESALSGSLPVPWPAVATNERQYSPVEVAAESLADLSGSLALFLDVSETNSMYGPRLLDIFGQSQIAEIIVLTRLVGMHVPGLHSLFTEIKLKRSLNPDMDAVLYKVLDFDTRFNLATIACRSPSFESRLKAFLSPSSVKQAAYADILLKAGQLNVNSQRALVIGGSRGLGEVTVKSLAAGGADVLLTYCTGLDDAQAIVDDVVSCGGKARALRCDVSGPMDEALSAFVAFKPTHVYFFATPYIFSGHKDNFSYVKFQGFSGCYIEAFNKILQPLIAAGTRNFFYPSTVAIDEMPAAMGEYIVAKAAAEAYCQWMTQNRPQLTIFTPRLPRLATDQTVSVLNADNRDAGVMIEYISAFLAQCGPHD